MRVLAIDFGERRVGLAVSDPEGRFALPLVTLARSSDLQVINEISAIVIEESIDLLVIGEPRRLDGSRGDAARRIASFAEKLQQRTELPYLLVDEALTSREAEERLRESGVDPRSHPERVDTMAAQILLEEVLARSAGEEDR